ncbi:unnamed protein product [Owenia fusiformis]|uniref:tRNA wybutosine-synthesizing protein 3 homolog n=1 Tax=Owenia fusiformis TaxID=6347 RepID=A0A8J1TC02_OWEFU|nr:unnamed protein product [Owenia fusiformis]
MSAFDNQKKQCLAAVDLSRKGSIDAPIVELIEKINSSENYFTTSSCSGRLCIYESGESRKKGCKWLLVSHTSPEVNEVNKSLEEISGDVVFKFEPFILHIQCREVGDAQTLHAAAVASGMRNSGITIGQKGKIIIAIRSTQHLEAPLSHNGEMLVSSKYIEHLVKLTNEKFVDNLVRIERFTENFVQLLQRRNSENLGKKSDKKHYPEKKFSDSKKGDKDNNIEIEVNFDEFL